MPSLNSTARDYMASSISTGWSTATLTILAGGTTLATHTLAGFGAPSNGVITASAIANSTIAASGTATSATLTLSGRTLTLSIGTSGTEVVVANLSYVAGGTSTISSLAITYPAS
jgi:hypothetical protein